MGEGRHETLTHTKSIVWSSHLFFCFYYSISCEYVLVRGSFFFLLDETTKHIFHAKTHFMVGIRCGIVWLLFRVRIHGHDAVPKQYTRSPSSSLSAVVVGCRRCCCFKLCMAWYWRDDDILSFYGGDCSRYILLHWNMCLLLLFMCCWWMVVIVIFEYAHRHTCHLFQLIICKSTQLMTFRVPSIYLWCHFRLRLASEMKTKTIKSNDEKCADTK